MIGYSVMRLPGADFEDPLRMPQAQVCTVRSRGRGVLF